MREGVRTGDGEKAGQVAMACVMLCLLSVQVRSCRFELGMSDKVRNDQVRSDSRIILRS